MPAIDAVRDVYERGVDAGVFRQDIDPIDLHMSISALCFFNVSNRHTFSLIFKLDTDVAGRAAGAPRQRGGDGRALRAQVGRLLSRSIHLPNPETHDLLTRTIRRRHRLPRWHDGGHPRRFPRRRSNANAGRSFAAGDQSRGFIEHTIGKGSEYLVRGKRWP